MFTLSDYIHRCLEFLFFPGKLMILPLGVNPFTSVCTYTLPNIIIVTLFFASLTFCHSYPV